LLRHVTLAGAWRNLRPISPGHDTRHTWGRASSAYKVELEAVVWSVGAGVLPPISRSTRSTPRAWPCTVLTVLTLLTREQDEQGEQTNFLGLYKHDAFLVIR
jgi:hypothetical protein